MTEIKAPAPSALEDIPGGEAARIENIVSLTLDQLKQRYAGKPAIRRGVHPKDHGCVIAKFTILDSIPKELQVGLFSKPGHRYDALIRFSNAEVNADKPDSDFEVGEITRTDKITHGSRGMAVKVMRVTGSPLQTANLVTTRDPLNQDFLMINQPVFAFANVVDYEALSEVLLQHKDEAKPFFLRTTSEDNEIKKRAFTTAGIVKRIASNDFPTKSDDFPPAFQSPPVSPLDNRYFSAAAFLFGEGRAMKFSARPVAPAPDKVTDISDPIYLRTALKKRLAAAGGEGIEFDFQVQVRKAESLAGKIAEEIEDVCFLWREEDYPFETVAKISIPPQDQDIDSDERKALCEDLTFSPWNGLADHRPLGGINRLRRAVYEASARTRHVPGVCPWDGG